MQVPHNTSDVELAVKDNFFVPWSWIKANYPIRMNKAIRLNSLCVSVRRYLEISCDNNKTKQKQYRRCKKEDTHKKNKDKNVDAKRATHLFFLWLHRSETAAPSAPVTMGTSASAPRKQIGPPPR